MTRDLTAQLERALREARLLHQAGRLDEARALCQRALTLRPGQTQALTLLGIICAQTGDFPRAVAFFDEVLVAEPRNVGAHNNRANALRALQRPAEAVASYDRAIALQPDHAPIYSSRGHALFDLQRYEDALASLDRAIALGFNHPAAWHVRGNALYSLERFQEAAASYERAIALDPKGASSHHNRGNALAMLGQYESAIASYDGAIALDPGSAASHGERLHARMQIADWRDFGPEVARLTARIERYEAASNPFTLLSLVDSPALQRLAARNWVREKCPPDDALGARRPLPPLPGSRSQRIHVGYFSADFRAHATVSLTAGLFEAHDRSRFELTAFAFGSDTQDDMRRRAAAAFDRFLDVGKQSDHDIARLARSSGIDVAVDLGGFTRGSRPRIFALRAAPLQVSYLGYLGTMSAEYMDYLVADDTVIPQALRMHYAEKIVYLPSYQVNDSKRPIAPRRFTREELGLPRQGFVFCCLNSTYKLTPDTFDGWMRILTRVPGSVLYLLGGSPALEGNLRREAQARGVAGDRIVFGARLPPDEYLARYRTVDLFLDTLPYNAGTTASDALWAGLPVLTCTGATFAGRVGSSVLRAAGLPELVASTPQQYEQLAVELASNPARLAGVRTKLTEGLRTAALFDTAASTRHLEAAYATMYERYQAGLPPEDIHVSPT
jgi:predicted O-linked N-acetylglucosamine transferase (SPINDLY family)